MEGLVDKVKKLEDLIKSCGSFNLIANMIVKNQIVSAENYSDAQPDKLHILPEYISLLCLKFPYSKGIGEVLVGNKISEILRDINNLSKEIILSSDVFKSNQLSNQSGGNYNEDFNQIVNSVKQEEYYVRNPAIEEHHWEIIEELYLPFNDFLKSNIGFDSQDAIDLCIAIHQYTITQVKNSKQDVEKRWQDFYWEIIRFKKNKVRPNKYYPDDVLLNLSKLNEKQLKAHFISYAYSYEHFIIGQKLSFTAKDISDFSELKINIVESFLNCLSINFGEISTDFLEPQIIHPLKEKPLIRHEDRFICPSFSLLDYSIDKLFDRLLQSSKHQEKYKTLKHDYLVDKGVDLLISCLNGCKPYKNLFYNDGNNGELDAVLLYDNCAFFIEAKSHKITDRAKKGFSDRIENHIEDIIHDSYAQAIRASKYFLSSTNPSFTNKKGQKIVLSSERVKNIFLISLSYDPIANISLYLKASNTLKLFDEGFPWIIGLYDLMIFAEHIDGPSFLIDYLTKRELVLKIKNLHIDDEIDLMGNYLRDGFAINTDLLNEDVSWGKIQSYSDHLNRYYFYKNGISEKPIPKLVHFASPKTKNLVSAIENSNLDDRLDLTAFILRLDKKSQHTLNEQILKCKKKYKIDKNPQHYTFGGIDAEKEWSITYFVGSDSLESSEAFEKIGLTMQKEKKVNSWIGIMDCGVKEFNFIALKVFHSGVSI